MNIKLETAAMALARGAVLSVTDGHGTRITCLAGRIWITQHGDSADIVLDAGQDFTLDRPGLALVEAIRPADIVIRSSLPGDERRPPLGAPAARHAGPRPPRAQVAAGRCFEPA